MKPRILSQVIFDRFGDPPKQKYHLKKYLRVVRFAMNDVPLVLREA